MAGFCPAELHDNLHAAALPELSQDLLHELLVKQICSHGKGIDQECLACAKLWRIEQRKDAELQRLKAELTAIKELA